MMAAIKCWTIVFQDGTTDSGSDRNSPELDLTAIERRQGSKALSVRFTVALLNGEVDALPQEVTCA